MWRRLWSRGCLDTTTLRSRDTMSTRAPAMQAPTGATTWAGARPASQHGATQTNKRRTTIERERRRGGGTSSLLVDHLLREPTPSLASAEKDLSTTLPEYMAEHIVLVPFSTAMVLDQLVPTLFVTLSLMRVVVSHGP